MSEDREDPNGQAKQGEGMYMYLGIGLGALVLAALAVALVLVLVKKKRRDVLPDDDDCPAVELDTAASISFDSDKVGEFVTQIQTGGTALDAQWSAQQFTEYQDIFNDRGDETGLWR
jgi:hypothetical protein